jgi:hypothetical protein
MPSPPPPGRVTLAWLRTKAGPAVDVHTAARALGVSEATTYRAIAAGTFPCRSYRVAARHCIVTADLIALLAPRPEPGPARPDLAASA